MSMVRHKTLIAASIASLVVGGVLGVPIALFFATHPLPIRAWPMVIVPNAILLIGVWSALFFAIRALIRP